LYDILTFLETYFTVAIYTIGNAYLNYVVFILLVVFVYVYILTNLQTMQLLHEFFFAENYHLLRKRNF